MPDSAPDPKVEDVLSSVRRLVSGDVQRRTSRPGERGGDAGALVLTPAHRVGEKAETAEKPRESRRSLEERIAELEAAVDRGTEEFEPDGSEDQAQHRPDRIVYTRPPKSDEMSDRTALRLSQIALIETGPAADEGEGADEEAVPFRRESSRSPAEAEAEAPMAENVPPMTTAADVFAFRNPDDEVEGIEARIERRGQRDEPSILVAGGDAPAGNEPQENMLRDEDRDDRTDDDGAGTNEAEFDEALSEAVAASVSSADGGESQGDAEPGDFLDQDEVLAYVDPDPHAAPKEGPGGKYEASGETPQSRAPAAEAPDAEDEDAPAAAAAALNALPDEDAMRLLVARLIREELQGQLGERITRNVRKLVRREIMRALDARDLM